jgi:hypothetical protein
VGKEAQKFKWSAREKKGKCEVSRGWVQHHSLMGFLHTVHMQKKAAGEESTVLYRTMVYLMPDNAGSCRL